MTRPPIEDIRARADAATEGPWWQSDYTPNYLQTRMQRHHGGVPLTIRSNMHTEEIATVWTHLLPVTANAEFLAHARTDIPALCDYIDELERELGVK